jgi:hypothetical protein
LLSIDVDAHLQKLAAHTFGSRAHYPVELVRLALSRGAERVELTIKPDRVEIHDDGRGIETNQLFSLYRLVTPNGNAAERERAIESLKTHRGIGLLAIFSPAPQQVVIENVSGSEKKSILIKGGALLESASCGIDSGTRIFIYRNSGEVKKEKEILQDYCRAVPKDIILNGKVLEKMPVLTPPPIVALKLDGSQGVGAGQIGIPIKGDLCKILFLDQGIPYFHTTLRPWKGFVFSIAVEYPGDLTGSFLNRLTEPLSRLYYRLAQRYPTYPESYRARVEELLFKHNRLGGEHRIVNAFSPFKVVNSPLSLSLSQVSVKASREVLYAIPETENPARCDTRDGTTLLLSRNQVDFLVNFHRLPLHFLTPVKYHKRPLLIFRRGIEKLKTGISLLLTMGRKTRDHNELTGDEKNFVKALTGYLSARGIKNAKLLPGLEIETVFINGRGIDPGVFKDHLLLINRGHPLVRRAIHAYRLDPRSIELAAAIFS